MHELAPGLSGIFIVFGMCVLVPLAFIAGLVWLIARHARNRHEERMAAIARGAASPADAPPWRAAPPLPVVPRRRDPFRGVGWAVALLACGLLWAFDVPHFACMLVGAGAGFLVRGVLGLRRDAARPDDPLPPREGEPR